MNNTLAQKLLDDYLLNNLNLSTKENNAMSRFTRTPFTPAPTAQPAPPFKPFPSSIEWEVVQKNALRTLSIQNDTIFAAWRQPLKKKPTTWRFQLKFANNILENLNWKAGDFISVSQNPDDLFHILLAQGTQQSGFRLYRPTGIAGYHLLDPAMDIKAGMLPIPFAPVEEWDYHGSGKVRDQIVLMMPRK